MAELEISIKETFQQTLPQLSGKQVLVVQYSMPAWELPLHPDEAYIYAQNGSYYWKEEYTGPLEHLGGWQDFLIWLAWRTGWNMSLEVIQGHYEWRQWRAYACMPVRELLRRHFDQAAKIWDVDLCISINKEM